MLLGTMGTAIRCPSCRCEFELSAVMRSELEAELRAAIVEQFEGQASAMQAAADAGLREKEAELAETRTKLAVAENREADVLKLQRELAEREQRFELDVERRVESAAKRIREQEANAARERFSREADGRVRVKQEELLEARAKLAEATSREAELLKKERHLDSRERELAVVTERRVAEETAKVRAQETKLAEERTGLQQEQQRLRDEEHRQRIFSLEKTIIELTRKVQQGSQQVQGEAQEVVLRDLLTVAFPTDSIEDVPKGVQGADLVQAVHGGDGRECGSIVWESKRTRGWQDGWLPKVRDDQREAGAACAVIVTQALPPDIRHFGPKEGVWVCCPSYAVPLGAALRAGLLEVAAAKRGAEGSGQKMKLLYDYMTGTEFKNRVEGLVEAFVEMQEELCSERRTTLTRWKRREKLIDRALDNITALCGELQGIAGRQFQDLFPPALDSVRALPEPGGDEKRAEELDDAGLKQLLLALLPDDGSTVGNASLSDLFVARALTELRIRAVTDDYERCKEALLTEGHIRRGKGRGGSVCRVVAAAAE
jgi:hypothetical protein